MALPQQQDPRINALGLQVPTQQGPDLASLIAALRSRHEPKPYAQGPILSGTQVAAGMLDTAADQMQENRLISGAQQGQSDFLASLTPPAGEQPPAQGPAPGPAPDAPTSYQGGDTDQALSDFVKGHEGFKPMPYADGKQVSIGYGTRAQPGDTSIDRDEADRRLQGELGKAAASVETFAPNAPSPIKHALADLTYNAGTKWQGAGLGQAVRAGDWPTAKGLFTQYSHADGKFNQGLYNRRLAMSGAFDLAGGPAGATRVAGPPMAPAVTGGAPGSTQTSTPTQGAPGASGAPAGSVGATGGTSGQIIGPQFLRPRMSPQQMDYAQRALMNPFLPQHQRDQIIQMIQGQQQPYSVPHPSGNGVVMIDPRTGAQQHIPAHGDEYKEIGKDAFGNPNYGFVNPYTHQVTPVKPGGAPGGFDTSNVNWDLSGEDFLKQFPSPIQSQVKAYVEGRQMPTGNPRSGNVQMVKQIATKYGDDVGMQADDTTYNARKTMRNNLNLATPGSLGGQINNGNTAIGHLADLSESAAKLGNWNFGFAPLSHAVNVTKNLFGDQSAIVQDMKDTALKYGQEITKFYAGSGGGVEERTRFEQAVSNANTPKELSAVLSREAELMQSKLGSLETQIRGTLGPGYLAEHPVMNAGSAAAIGRLNDNLSKLNGFGQQTQGGANTPSVMGAGAAPIVQGQQDARGMIDTAIKKSFPGYQPTPNQPTFLPLPAMGPTGSALPGVGRATPSRPLQGTGNPNAMPPGVPPAGANHGSFRDWAKGAATFQGAETLKSVIQHLLGL